MSEVYINRFTCDFCKREADSLDGEMPDGWRMVLVNKRREDGGLDVTRHHFCSWRCEHLTEAGVNPGNNYQPRGEWPDILAPTFPINLDPAKLKAVAERLRDEVNRQIQPPLQLGPETTMGTPVKPSHYPSPFCTCEQSTASYRVDDQIPYCVNCGKPI